MKKIALTIMISFLTTASVAENVFNHQIPQPNLITNDWDGDGLTNDVDTDDDGDNIPDTEDDNPFSGRPVFGGSSSIGGYNGDTCEDNNLDASVVTALNNWSGFNHDSSAWCSMTQLNVYNSGLTEIAPEIAPEVAALTNLTRIRAYGNSLPETDFPDLSTLTNLNELNLSSNGWSEVPANIFKITSLTRLHLIGNNLVSLHDDVGI